MNKFLELLKNKPVICDGAVGTELIARIGKSDQCIDQLNITQPDLVRGVHRDYVAAGAQIIETNTFGANRIRLSSHGCEDMCKEINLAGVKLAKEEAGDKAVVAGSIGPTGKLLEPYGTVTVEDVRAAFAEQAKYLAEAGVDVIFVETMSDIREATAAIQAAKETGLPVVAQMSFTQEGKTMMGIDPATAVRNLEELGVEVIGANCGTGFNDMLDVVNEMIAATKRPLIAQPNAGFPKLVDGRLVYVSGPAYMADFAKQFADLGVSIIGGCCGTTPEHIRAIAEVLRG